MLFAVALATSSWANPQLANAAVTTKTLWPGKTALSGLTAEMRASEDKERGEETRTSARQSTGQTDSLRGEWEPKDIFIAGSVSRNYGEGGGGHGGEGHGGEGGHDKDGDGHKDENKEKEKKQNYDTTNYTSFQSYGYKTPQGSFNKIFSIWFENHGMELAEENSYWRSIMSKAFVLESYFGVSYPSQPNYVATLGGQYINCTDDAQCYLETTNLVDLLENRGKTWKGYMEGYQQGDYGACNTVEKICGQEDGSAEEYDCYMGYFRKHNGFMAWTTITEDEDRCQNIVNEYQFATDVKNGNLPNFAMYTPNINHDSHDNDLDYSGAFLQDWLDTYFYPYPDTWHDVLLFVVFQADDRSEYNHVPAFIMTSSSHKYFRTQDIGTDTNYNPNGYNTSHYSFAKLVQDNFGLGNMGYNDVYANAIFLPLNDYDAGKQASPDYNYVNEPVGPLDHWYEALPMWSVILGSSFGVLMFGSFSYKFVKSDAFRVIQQKRPRHDSTAGSSIGGIEPDSATSSVYSGASHSSNGAESESVYEPLAGEYDGHVPPAQSFIKSVN
eukprot:gb/GEZN01002255.1/.p1 GENE.gb/GEZN01002255.1/~~gb/GEZN01002255.1/.p1  ORF type:complete len:554 (-),score=72.52 gb/GEZN01002255.1/:705-2366(-)